MPLMIAECGACQWGPPVWSEDEKERKELAHKKRWHPDLVEEDPEPTTDELCARMIGEYGDDADKVLEAIRAVAVVNNGRVDLNAVRELLPKGTLKVPQVRGSVVRVMKGAGYKGWQLVEVGSNVNNDTRSGNAGKPQTVYALERIEGRRTA